MIFLYTKLRRSSVSLVFLRLRYADYSVKNISREQEGQWVRLIGS